jgi:hypothetical protein
LYGLYDWFAEAKLGDSLALPAQVIVGTPVDQSDAAASIEVRRHCVLVNDHVGAKQIVAADL